MLASAELSRNTWSLNDRPGTRKQGRTIVQIGI